MFLFIRRKPAPRCQKNHWQWPMSERYGPTENHTIHSYRKRQKDKECFKLLKYVDKTTFYLVRRVLTRIYIWTSSTKRDQSKCQRKYSKMKCNFFRIQHIMRNSSSVNRTSVQCYEWNAMHTKVTYGNSAKFHVTGEQR